MKKLILLSVLLSVAFCCSVPRIAPRVLPIAESNGYVELEYGARYYKYNVEDILACDTLEYVDGLAYVRTVGDQHLFSSFHKVVNEGMTRGFAIHESECIVEEDCVEGPDCWKFQFRWAIEFNGIFIVRKWPPLIKSDDVLLEKNASSELDFGTIKYFVFAPADLARLDPVYVGSTERYHLFRMLRRRCMAFAIPRESCKIDDASSPEEEAERIVSDLTIRVGRYVDGKFVVSDD